MTYDRLARSYIEKALLRLKVLDVYMELGGYSDVVREAQEAVELSLKGILRYYNIDPPRWHDVGDILLQNADKIASLSLRELKKMAKISKRLRKERELSFYGDVDFIPTEEYDEDFAQAVMDDAKFVIEAAKRIIS